MRPLLDRLYNNWQMKLTAFALAFFLWAAVQTGKPYRHRINVPVRVENADREWIASRAPVPAYVSITFTGPYRELVQLARSSPAIVIPVADVQDSMQIVPLQYSWLQPQRAGSTVSIREMAPDTARLSFDRVATRLVALQVQFSGAITDGYELTAPPEANPLIVRASGPAGRLAALDTIKLPPIDISGLTAPETVSVTIDTAALGVSVTPRRVRIVVPVRAKTPLLQDTLR